MARKSKSKSEEQDYTTNYFEFIPAALRDTRQDAIRLSPETVRFMYQRWENMNIDELDHVPTDLEVLSWLSGCIGFQDTIENVDNIDGMSFFSAQIIGVEELELENDGEVFAQKTRIFLWNRLDEKTEEYGVSHIDTDITNYESDYLNAANAWDIALAKTNAKIAASAVGEMGIFLKQVESKGKVFVRHAVTVNKRRIMDRDEVIDESEFEELIEEYRDGLEQNSRNKKGGRSGGSSRGRGRSSGDSGSSRGRGRGGNKKSKSSDWKSQVDEAVEKLDEDEVLEDGDIKFIAATLKKHGDSKDDVQEAILDELELEDFNDNDNEDIAEYAVQLFIDNI